MRASVVIVTYEHRDAIRVCLDALLPTLGPNDEVVVVDNASRDRTAEVVASYGPPVRLVRSPTNGGFGKGCNVGAGSSSGIYLVFLNPDTETRPGWLPLLLSALVDDVAFVTPKLLLAAHPDRIDALGNDVHVSGIPTCRRWGEPAAGMGMVEEVGAISGACFAVRREVFDMLAGFDERLFLYFEDTDLSLRARLAGYRCLVVPTAEVIHDHEPGISARKLYYLERNRWWTILKLYRWRTIAALVPVLLLAECAAWAIAVGSGPRHLTAKLRAWAELLRWLRHLGAARREAARTRRVSDRALLLLHQSRLPFAQLTTGRARRLGEAFAALSFRAARAVADVIA